MITLPTKFQTFLNAGKSKPMAIVKLGESITENTQSSQSDWANNTSESNVDYNTSKGDVILDAATPPGITQNTSDSTAYLAYEDIGSNVYNNVAWQSFKQISGWTKTLNKVSVYYDIVWTGGINIKVSVAIYNMYLTQVTNTITKTYTASSGASLKEFDFSGENKNIYNNATYWIKVSAEIIGIGYATLYYHSVSTTYADGQMNLFGDDPAAGADVGDMRFAVSFTGDYFVTSGNILTQTMDLGETPSSDGEWILKDVLPNQYGSTTITYTGYGSTDNFSASNVNIGTIEDGDTITSGDYYRYYRIYAALATTSANETPILQEAGVSFVTYSDYSNQYFNGVEESVHNISSLTTSIDDFNLTTVGQITISFGFTESISTFLNTYYPKNKPVKILLGFKDPDFTEDDFILFYKGTIEKFTINQKHEVVFTIKDNNQNWKIDVPIETTVSAGYTATPSFTDITASAEHPIDIMLEILQDQLDIRDAYIDIGSFESAKSTLSSWVVTRTIDDTNREKAEDLLNELRVLVSGYFIPKANGKITFKLWDTSEATVADLTDDDFLTIPEYDSNYESLVNELNLWFDYNTGTEEFDGLFKGINLTSQSNYNQVAIKEIEDKWTVYDAQGVIQMGALSTNIITRYANPPAKINVTIDYKWLWLEVGDQVTITTINAPSSDFTGMSERKFQIINKNLDPQTFRVRFVFLEVNE